MLLPLPFGCTHTSLHSSWVLNRLSLPSQPPYQNREHPPYSVSKYHLTVKSRQGPLSLSKAHAAPGVGGTERQPSKFSPWASSVPSGQHPYFEASQVHPAKFGPIAGVLPSEQHLNSVFSQPQPAWNVVIWNKNYQLIFEIKLYTKRICWINSINWRRWISAISAIFDLL